MEWVVVWCIRSLSRVRVVDTLDRDNRKVSFGAVGMGTVEVSESSH